MNLRHPCVRKVVEGMRVDAGLYCLKYERSVGADDGTDENHCTEIAGGTGCRRFEGNWGAEACHGGRD
jgi:hypothetical protein